MDITQAKVRFVADNSLELVPLSEIKDFNGKKPAHRNDFDPHKLYKISWKDDKNPKGIVIAGQIGGFCGDGAEGAALMAKRTTFPTVTLSDKEQFSADCTEEDVEENSTTDLKLTYKTDKKIKAQNLHSAKLKTANDIMAILDANSDDEESQKGQGDMEYSEDKTGPRKKRQRIESSFSESDEQLQSNLSESDDQLPNEKDDFHLVSSGFVQTNKKVKAKRQLFKNTDSNVTGNSLEASSHSAIDTVGLPQHPSASHALHTNQTANINIESSSRLEPSSYSTIGTDASQSRPSTSNALLTNQPSNANCQGKSASKTQRKGKNNKKAECGKKIKKHYRIFRLKTEEELEATQDDDLRVRIPITDGGIEVRNPENLVKYQIFEQDDKKLIYLGGCKALEHEAWMFIKTNPRWSFMRAVAAVIWSKRIIVNRCINLSQTQIRLQDRSPRKQCTPRKHKHLKELFMDYLCDLELPPGTISRTILNLNYQIGQFVKDLRNLNYTEVFEYEDDDQENAA